MLSQTTIRLFTTNQKKTPTTSANPGKSAEKCRGTTAFLFLFFRSSTQQHKGKDTMGSSSKSPKRKRESTEEGTPKKKRRDSSTDVSMSDSPRKEKKEKKSKKEKKDKDVGESNDDSQMNILEKCEAQRPFANAIASPMADVKETKKLLSLVHKAAGEKQIRRGVKEVVKAIRKNEKGICVIAGDISPIDVVTHIPVLCENAGLPYAFVPSKEALGFSCFTKRPTSVVIIKEGDSFKKDYQKAFEATKALRA